MGLIADCLNAWIQEGGGGGLGGPGVQIHSPENLKAIGFLGNNVSDLLENQKAAQSSLNVGPSVSRQRNAIKMAFRWWADDGSFSLDTG